MDLTRLFEAQRKLDRRIIEEKGLEGQSLLAKKVVALITELGECANEWRGFKFWSENRQPRSFIKTTEGATEENADEFFCGNCNEHFERGDRSIVDVWGDLTEECPECFAGALFPMRFKNPLLEEFVDVVHFSLSLVIDTHEDITLLSELTPLLRKDVHLEYQFALAAREASSILLSDQAFRKISASHTLRIVLGIGKALGFTEEQIETAYFEKNATNHRRQEEHY